MNEKRVDELCKMVLRTTESPSEKLNRATKALMKEKIAMRKSGKNKFRIAAAVMVAALVLPVGVSAAVRYLTPKEVAEELNYQFLAEAFAGKDSNLCSLTISSGGYNITFMGITFGKNLIEYSEAAEVDKTYAVVAIERQNGESMEDAEDFFVSPLIGGCQPWQVNIFTLNDSGSGAAYFTKDGVQYRLIECDSIEMFADRDLYIGVSTNNGPFCNNESFCYNEETGKITSNTKNGAVSAVFTLALDKSKADPEKAAQILNSLKMQPEEETGEEAEIDNQTDTVDGEMIVFAPQGATLLETHVFTDGEAYRVWMETMLKKDEAAGIPANAIALDRKEHEARIADIENGTTVTVREYDDGSVAYSTSYPDRK